MHHSPEQIARHIVTDILDDLLGRSGIGNELEDIKNHDTSTWTELKQTLSELVVQRLSAATPKVTQASDSLQEALDRLAAEKSATLARAVAGGILSYVYSETRNGRTAVCELTIDKTQPNDYEGSYRIYLSPELARTRFSDLVMDDNPHRPRKGWFREGAEGIVEMMAEIINGLFALPTKKS